MRYADFVTTTDDTVAADGSSSARKNQSTERLDAPVSAEIELRRAADLIDNARALPYIS
jgi:hypothetical protein